MPYEQQLFEVEDFDVDNSGNVYLLGSIFEEKRRAKRKPNYKYEILSYSNQGNDRVDYPIQIEGKFLTDMQIAIDDKPDIVCGGFYPSEGTFSIEGSYFLKVDNQSKEIKSKAFQKFGLDFITRNMSSQQEKTAKKKSSKGEKCGVISIRFG